MTKININGINRDMTAEEQADYDERFVVFDKVAEKLKTIKNMRLQKLQETDFYALQDVSMSNEMKTWRQSLRDIPANHTDEAAYDLLLARDEKGNLTHSVWSKP